MILAKVILDKCFLQNIFFYKKKHVKNRRLRFGMEAPPRLRTKETKNNLLRIKNYGPKTKDSPNFIRLTVGG